MSNNKVAFVLDGLNIGGIERVAINYLKILDKLGYDVTIYNLNIREKQLYNEIPKNFKVIDINFKKSAVIGTYDMKMKKNRLWTIFRPIIKLFLDLKDKKLRKHSKGTDYQFAIAFSGHLNDLQFINNNHINSKHKIAWLHGSLSDYTTMSKHFESHYNSIYNLIELSKSIDESGLRKYNMKTLYNPVDILNKDLSLKEVESYKSLFGEYILMVARFSRQKDHYTVIDALKILQDKYKIYNKLVFVGDGKTIKKVKKYAKDRNIINNIVFEGAKANVQDYYASAKVFVHSSPEEGLPTVLIESMFFKLPIVSTNSLPGVPELLGDSEYGLICPVGDAETMAAYLYKMLMDDKLYSYYQQQSFERSKEFSFEKISKQLQEYLTSIE